MAKDKKRKNEKVVTEEQKQPYSNMAARRVVLFIGLALSIAGLLLLVLGALDLFVTPNIFKVEHPVNGVIAILAACAGVSFVALVFAVAGANTAKPIARLSFFFSIVSFIVAAGMLVAVLLVFKLLIPLPGLEHIAGGLILP